MAPIIGIAVFIILIVLDIIGHKKLKVKRKLVDWCFLCLFIVGAGIFIANGILQIMPHHKDGANGKYLAYKYLMDDKADYARAVLLQDNTISDENKKYIEMLAYGVEGDVEKLYFAADAILSDTKLLTNQENVANELKTIAMNSVVDKKKQKARIAELVEESYKSSGITETAELLSYYKLDSSVKSGNTDGVTKRELDALAASFPEDQTVLKLAVNYYVQIEDFESAKKTGEQLLGLKKSEGNHVILADVYAEQAYKQTEDELKESDDNEIKKEAEKSEAAARAVVYSRISNYIKVKMPFFSNGDGLYELQLIKMEILKGRTDKAFESLMELVGRASSLKDSSMIKRELLNLRGDIEKYQMDHEEKYEAVLFEDCEKLLAAQGQEVITVARDTINSRAAKELAAFIIYDVKELEITGVDPYSYPKVTFTVKTNVKKSSIFGTKGEFYKDDFKITDNGVEITDYTLVPKVNSDSRTAVLAVDMKGLSGDELNDVQNALETMMDPDFADKYAFVDTNANVVCTFNETVSAYSKGIKALDTNGTASCFDIIDQACTLLTEKKYEERVLVVFSNDLKLDDIERNTLLKTIRENDIECYVVTMDKADTEAAKSLAVNSNGMAFGVNLSVELKALVNDMKKLLNNCYVFSYKADEQSDIGHEIEITLVPEELTANREYMQEEES